MATGTLFHLLLPPKPKFLSNSLHKPQISFNSLHKPTRPLLFPQTTSPLLKSPLRPNIKHLAFTPPPPNSLPSISLTPISISLTPFSICKYSLLVSLAIYLTKTTISFLLNPFFWTYFSLSWPFYPYFLAASVAIYGLYSLRKHTLNQSNLFHQLAILTSAVTWLTLVPVAHFNGFLEGWPLVIFFVYHYFFFFETSVRKRLYGDLLPRPHDPKWDLSLPVPFRVTFFVLILVGHFLAAYEGPELHLIPGGWANLPVWVLLALTIFMRYHSVLYLAKYSEKVVVSTAVAQFGPYRWVRHPIYASVVALFSLHCVTLRAPLSMAFLVVVCVWYYGRKAEMEEAAMVEVFGERYKEYMDRVRYRLIPLLY